MNTPAPVLGTDVPRAEGRAKVTGTARYAAEHLPPRLAHAWPVPATVASGRVTAVHDTEVLRLPGVVAVLSHENARRLATPDDPTLHVLQDPRVPHFGWYVAVVVAETLEAARAGALALRVTYETDPHDVELRPGHTGIYRPHDANGGNPTDRERGDFADAFATAPVRVDRTYRIAPLHNHPMEPHASVASWEAGRLVVHDSSQGTNAVRTALATLFGMPEEDITVHSPHVGGGFGSKGTPRPQPVLAALAALHVGRPVKLALPRRQLPAVVGHRAPTLHRVRLGAAEDGTLSALAHEIITHTSRIKEFVETGRRARPRHVHLAAQPHDPPRPAPRRPQPLLDARPRRGPRHVRARIGHGRTRRGRRDRPRRTAGPQRARRGARLGTALQQPPPRRVPAGRRGALRLAHPRPAPRRAPRGPPPARHRRRGGDVPGPRLPLDGRGHRAPRRHVRGTDQRHRHRHGCPHRPRADRRRRARRPARPRRPRPRRQ
ncbi:oxidoreductase [Streptomyces sp. SPB78]|nr:oxidoreductase [Streptomyces sp. SPB78]